MKKSSCRLCHSPYIESVARLPNLPLVDAYSKVPNNESLYRCGLQMCGECGHIQLSEVIAPDMLFRSEYLFFTSDYPWLVEHYRAYAAKVHEEFHPNFVVEIGSNDGTLLKLLQERGCEVLGVDPSSVPSSVMVMREFFNEETPDSIPTKADLIIANHVFAHNDDLSTIVRGVKKLLAPGGVFVFETNSGLDLLQKHLFDIVYHEHMDYHTVQPLVGFFYRHGLTLFRVAHNESKGGTLRGYVCHDGMRAPEASVNLSIALEQSAGAYRPGVFRAWTDQLEERRQEVLRKLRGTPFIGYGAAAGGIATLHHLGLSAQCQWIVDDSPRRLGMYAPHSNLQVKNPQTLYHYEVHHDFTKVVILSWRYAQKIRAAHPNLEMIVP